MKKYFNKFKNMKRNDEQGVEVNTPLVERIGFREGTLYIDGKDGFCDVFKSLCNPINVMFISPENEDSSKGDIYLGTGSCCHGDLHHLHANCFNKITLEKITPVDFNVYDIVPVYESGREEISALVCGFGCDGGGVRLVRNCEHYIDMQTVMSTEEFFQNETPRSKNYFVVREDRIKLRRPEFDLTSRLEGLDIDLKKSFEMYSLGHREEK